MNVRFTGLDLEKRFGSTHPPISSNILVVVPSGCGKTCFTESLLLDHLEELFVSPPLIIARGCGKMDSKT